MIHSGKAFDISELSKHRTELMGFCAICIIICHFLLVYSGGGILRRILVLGNYGVQGFAFLSGIGLHRSIENRKGSLTCWYIRRLSRIVVPYLIVGIPYWTFYTINHSGGFWEFFKGISFISFWTNHKGFWFIAAMILVYLFTPIYYKIYSSIEYKALLTLGITMLLLLCSIQGELPQNDILWNLRWCGGTIAPFFIGFLTWDYIPNTRVTAVLAFFCSIGIFVVLSFLPIIGRISWWWILLLPVFMLISRCIDKRIEIIRKPLHFMGRITIESYMLNVALIDLYKYLKMSDVIRSHGEEKDIIAYAIIVIAGIGLSIPYNNFSKEIQRKFDRSN